MFAKNKSIECSSADDKFERKEENHTKHPLLNWCKYQLSLMTNG